MKDLSRHFLGSFFFLLYNKKNDTKNVVFIFLIRSNIFFRTRIVYNKNFFLSILFLKKFYFFFREKGILRFYRTFGEFLYIGFFCFIQRIYIIAKLCFVQRIYEINTLLSFYLSKSNFLPKNLLNNFFFLKNNLVLKTHLISPISKNV